MAVEVKGPDSPPAANALPPKPQKDTSAILQELYRQFPPPQPNPDIEGSAAAIESGKQVCAGKTPTQVKDEFLAESDLLPAQAEMVDELSHYEERSSKDRSFVAGQLAALVYERTLPEGIGAYGYQGCVYALARHLEGKISDGR